MNLLLTPRALLRRHAVAPVARVGPHQGEPDAVLQAWVPDSPAAVAHLRDERAS